ncbi:MAG: single-stranded-DNA-specific exonuclease RecJ [Defluviitaleaceae bacterium]|nr:single-stranded-DNA-specific exonuclease RecJ [Defluviitaleaceae bacterium]
MNAPSGNGANTAHWHLRQTDADLPLMARTLGITETTARVMANRGIRTKNTALAFLHPVLAPLRDMHEMKDIEAALERIARALATDEKIVIYGDYDVDGIMSTVILYRALTRLGGDVSYYVPHRTEEGYGLNMEAVEYLHADAAQLLITVDNGISAVEEIARAAELGIDTVIIDHHEAGDNLPPAIAIVDPKQPDCPYPFKDLCAAALVYKFCAALCEKINIPYIEEREMCTLAAIACICDIVSLADENRTLVCRGLAVLNTDKLINPGLGALITQRGYIDKTIDAYTIGFVLGPCLNATGRLESAEISIDLLLADDIDSRVMLAKDLIDLNDARKNLTKECVDRALVELEQLPELPKILVLTDAEAHESVAGIVAGRLRDHTGRPTILLTPGEAAWKGSGRSIPAYNLFEAMSAHRHLYHRFGGHAAAAGLTLPEENIPRLREALNHDCTLTEADFAPSHDIDAELDAAEITLELSRELERLAPFGKGNAAPLFVTRNLRVESVRNLHEKNTLIFTFKSRDNKRVKGIAFGLNAQYDRAVADAGVDGAGGFTLHAAYRIETNVYNGNVSVQMAVRDFVVL